MIVKATQDILVDGKLRVRSEIFSYSGEIADGMIKLRDEKQSDLGVINKIKLEKIAKLKEVVKDVKSIK